MHHQQFMLSVATVIQDEARWIPEWLEYHALDAVGVEHFFLYDDGSRDELSQALEPYILDGLVTFQTVSSLGSQPTTIRVEAALCDTPPGNWGLLSWDADGFCTRKLHFPQQLQMIRHAVRTHGHRTRYMAFIDVDEFVMVRKQPLAVVLDARWAAEDSRFNRYGGLSLRSLTMLPPGINHTKSPAEGELLTKVMLQQINPKLLAEIEPEAQGSGRKCVVRPSRVDLERCPAIHSTHISDCHLSSPCSFCQQVWKHSRAGADFWTKLPGWRVRGTAAALPISVHVYL